MKNEIEITDTQLQNLLEVLNIPKVIPNQGSTLSLYSKADIGNFIGYYQLFMQAVDASDEKVLKFLQKRLRSCNIKYEKIGILNKICKQ